MKFYYEGKLIRSSKCHVYSHAVLDKGRNNCCVGCRADKRNAEAVISSEISGNRRAIKNLHAMIKAFNEGKKGCWIDEGRGRSWLRKFDSDDSVESFEKWIKSHENRIAYIEENWVVVELEAR